jgi:carbamate kinase
LPDNTYEGIDAVVDKDLASAVLASDIEAEQLIILTGVSHVSLDFGKPKERTLSVTTQADLIRHLSDGHFPPGSMGPKIRAVIRFLAEGGRKAIISSPYAMAETLALKCGTHIYPSTDDIPPELRDAYVPLQPEGGKCP